MEERRRFVRLDTRVKMLYTVLPHGTPTSSMTKDVGGGGLRFFAHETFAPGTRLQVELILPDAEATIPFTGEVVWSERVAFIDKHQREQAIEVGVRVVEIAPDDQALVMRYILTTLRAPTQALA